MQHRPHLGLALLAALGCGAEDGARPPAPRQPGTSGPPAVSVASPDDTFDLATWNVEWFGDPGNGPADETLQRQNVAAIISGLEQDLWVLQEIVDADAFAALLRDLPGYDGLLANDPRVAGGPRWYRDFGDREQKTAFLWRTATVSLRDARVILDAHQRDFAGRPPVEARLRVRTSRGFEEIVTIAIHAKAGTGADDLARRAAGAAALARHVDARWPDAPVFIAGDFNDDLDASVRPGAPTPYAALLAESARLAAPTLALSRARSRSTVGFRDIIDHHVVSDEAMARYVTGSARVVRADRDRPRYAETTSDHYPVVARYALGAP